MTEENKNPFTVTDIDESIIDLTKKDTTETVIKTLLNEKHLPFITELSFDQIIEICKLKHISKKYGKQNFPDLNKKYPIEDNINEFINNFMLYMTSHKRKRVDEFLNGLKSERIENQKKPNFLSRMIGGDNFK